MTATLTRLQAVRGDAFKWDNVDDDDTPGAAEINGGRYTFSAVGTFDSTSIELQYSPDGTNYFSIDDTNLTFTAAGCYNFEIGAGYVKPVRTGGGGSMDVDLFLMPIDIEK